MYKYYYVCPRCGRVWRRFLPRRKMRCSFCSTEWKTRKARGTRKAFSWTATALWIFWIVFVSFVVYRSAIQYCNREENNKSVSHQAAQTSVENPGVNSNIETQNLNGTQEPDEVESPNEKGPDEVESPNEKGPDEVVSPNEKESDEA